MEIIPQKVPGQSSCCWKALGESVCDFVILSMLGHVHPRKRREFWEMCVMPLFPEKAKSWKSDFFKPQQMCLCQEAKAWHFHLGSLRGKLQSWPACVTTEIKSWHMNRWLAAVKYELEKNKGYHYCFQENWSFNMCYLWHECVIPERASAFLINTAEPVCLQHFTHADQTA